MSYYYYDNGNGGGQRGRFLGNLPVAVKNIIIINILVYLATSVNGDFMYKNFALFYPTSPFFHWWQPVTHMFMHGGFWHLFFNMYTLFIFGYRLLSMSACHIPKYNFRKFVSGIFKLCFRIFEVALRKLLVWCIDVV